MIDAFVQQFTSEPVLSHSISKEFYSIPPHVLEVMKSIPLEPLSAGIFLGETVKKRFIPSLPLLQMIGPKTEKIAVIDEKAEWLFLCGRDVFPASILKSRFDDTEVIVVNKKNEVLGLGIKSSDGVKNKHHLGEYLHEE